MRFSSKYFTIILVTLFAFGTFGFTLNDPNLTEEKTVVDPLDAQVSKIVASLTLEDKVGEMTQLTLDMVCVGEPYNLKEPYEIDKEKLKKVIVDLRVGSILNTGGHEIDIESWHRLIGQIQDAAQEKDSKIPVLYGIDAIHGVNYTEGATLFPQQLALAATWNPFHAKETGRITAYETRASGIPWNFSPVLDLGRDPRWPRFWETFGEDVYLAQAMGEAMIEGYQGDDPSSNLKVAACMKHFLGYSVTLSGKDRTPAWIADRQLKEYFVPTFQTAIDAGALTIMINSGEINGIPVHANPKILIDLLRDEMGFKGIAVSDWEDIKYLVTRHKVAVDYKDAIQMAVNAGVDMSMVPTDYEFPILLAELVREGKVPMSRIDEAVSRIIRVKMELGLFENAGPDFGEYPEFGSATHAQASYDASAEAITLLKNSNNILPLKKDIRLLITGPTANSLPSLNGGWTHTWQGGEEKYNTKGKLTIAEALISEYEISNAFYSEGCTVDEAINISQTVKMAEECDVIILCLGEDSYTEKPGDLDDLNISAAQSELTSALKATGKPIVIVLVEGRPRVVREEAKDADAILMAYLPGNEGGRAIADVLIGKINPSGKLPFSYPQYSNDLLTYDHKNTEAFDPTFGWEAYKPQWAFGYGLSYTTFKYKSLSLSASELNDSAPLIINVELTNTGNIVGKEVVQLYITDEVASITPSAKRLKDFEKVELKPGETQIVSFEIEPDDLKFVGRDDNWIIEDGTFKVQVGDITKQFELKSGRSNFSN